MDNQNYKSFTNVMDLWRTAADLAADIDEDHATVAKWRQRNNIPSRAWDALLKAARKRKFKLSPSDLVRLASERAAA